MRLFLSILISFFLFTSCGKSKPKDNYHYFQNYMISFADLNPKHLKTAKTIGVNPDLEQKKLLRQLNKIHSNRTFILATLSHSLPYLTSRGEDVLNVIGKNFVDSLSAKGLTTYKLTVTSVLRTKEHVKQLRKVNGNASKNSAHLYGTTFDISYAKFEKRGWGEEVRPELLKSILADVLLDLKKRNFIYVKYEYKQGCFHITARPKTDERS